LGVLGALMEILLTLKLAETKVEGPRVVARGKIILDRDSITDVALWETLPLKNGTAKRRPKTLVTA